MNWPRFKSCLCPASCQLYFCPGHHCHPVFPLPFFLTNLLRRNCSSHSHDSLSLRSFSSDHSFCPGPLHLEWRNCMLVAVGSLRFVQVYYTDWIEKVQSSMISRGIRSNHIFPEPIIFSLRQELDSLPVGLTFSVKSIFFFSSHLNLKSKPRFFFVVSDSLIMWHRLLLTVLLYAMTDMERITRSDRCCLSEVINHPCWTSAFPLL